MLKIYQIMIFYVVDFPVRIILLRKLSTKRPVSRKERCFVVGNITNNQSENPSLLILENVDRLLKSPAKQRGRDFAVMLKSLDDLGYVVEWRIINSQNMVSHRGKESFHYCTSQKNQNGKKN